MFGKTPAFSGFSVNDAAAAKKFYQETLGIKVTEIEGMGGGLLELHIEGGHNIFVYEKPNHTPASFTILNFPVDDVDAAVDGLAERGVELLRYDQFPHDDKGIVRDDTPGPDIAWFTDPAGNVLSVMSGM